MMAWQVSAVVVIGFSVITCATEFHHRANDELVMKGVGGGHDHLVGFCLGHHAIKVRGGITGRHLGAVGLGALAGDLDAARVGIAQRDELGKRRILDLDRVLVELMPRARSHDGVPSAATFFCRRGGGAA